MSLATSAITDRLVRNRRSYESDVCRNTMMKANLDINHRSVQSDPGVFELVSRRSDSSLISDTIMQKLEAAKANFQSAVTRRQRVQKGSFFGNSAGFDDTQPGRAGLLHSMCKYYPTQQCLYGSETLTNKLPVERRRFHDNRRVYCLDSQTIDHKFANPGRAISTSLSSSATSLYSEDDYIRSSVNASPIPSITSECPSVAPESCRNSLCCSEKCEDCVSLQKELNNNTVPNNQTEVKSNGILDGVKINYFNQNCLLENESSPGKAEMQETVAFSSLATVPEELSEDSNSCKEQTDETHTDNEEDEYEQYALSEFWHFEEDGRRWSRLDSKSSSIGSPSSRLPSTTGIKMDGIREDFNGDVFASEEHRNDTDRESPISEEKFVPTFMPKPMIVSESKEDNKSHPTKVFKPKGNSFFKRVGDFKKLGSFRRKELQKANAAEGGADSEPSRIVKSRSEGRVKGWRKHRKVVIGEPVLQCGQERFDHMRCVPIESSASGLKELQNQHKGRKNSAHSLVSSSSSSGVASSTSTPISKSQVHSDDFFFDVGAISPGIHGRNRAILEMNVPGGNVTLRSRETQADRANSFYLIPSSYKPGTFPSSIREKTEEEDGSLHAFSYPSSPSSTRSNSDSNQSTLEAPKKVSRPISLYDNLSNIPLDVSTQDVVDSASPCGDAEDSRMCEEAEESFGASLSGLDTAFWSVDDIVEHTQSLQQIVGMWVDEKESENQNADSPKSNLATSDPPAPLNILPSHNAEIVPTDDDIEQNSLPQSENQTQCRPRWQIPKESSKNVKPCEECLQFHTLSVGQLMILRRLSMLKLTALMETYAFNSNKGALNWSVPRFIRRMKVPDYKDKSVFGVPLLQNVQRLGQPLPFCIQHALAFLKRTALNQVGLFRKPGVRSRIQKLKEKCESDPELKNFDDCSVYDVADLVKQYFRELPDPLMTMKLSETFVGIFLYLPEELRLQTLQAATILLPDETREALKTLLLFLADVAARSDENHMNSTNLSTCFSPSLFYHQLNNPRLTSSSASPKLRKSQIGRMSGISLGKPEMKEMNENKAANECLGFMIRHVDELFKISEDAMTQCRMSVMQQTDDVLATEIGYTSDNHGDADYYTDFHSYVDRIVAQTVREEQRISQNKGGWQNVPSLPGADLMCKKINDGNPLRLWRSQVEISGASPSQIADRILNKQQLWDEDLLQMKVFQRPDERTQLYHTVQAEMTPHPNRDYCVLRSWRNDVNPRGALAIVETSTGQQALQGDVRGVILTSRYFIEPTDVPNKCTLTHVCRVDTKGRNPEWYNKAYGHIVSQRLLKIRNSMLENPPKA